MSLDKRECPNGNRLLWQNPQAITRHAAAADRIGEGSTRLSGNSWSVPCESTVFPACPASAFVLFYSAPLAC